MNALISLCIKVNIRLMLVGLSAWRRKIEIHNLILNSVLIRAGRPTTISLTRFMVNWSSCCHLHFGHAS